MTTPDIAATHENSLEVVEGLHSVGAVGSELGRKSALVKEASMTRLPPCGPLRIWC